MIRTFLMLTLSGVLALWLQVGLAPVLSTFGIHLSWLLLVSLFWVLYDGKRGVAYFALIMGLCADSLSHGVLGVYGFSFFVTALLGRSMNRWFYTNQSVFVGIALVALSTLEHAISLSLFVWLDPTLEISGLLMSYFLPSILAQGFLGALLAPIMDWFEKRESLQTGS